MAKKTFKGSIDPLEQLIGGSAPAEPAEHEEPKTEPAEPLPAKRETPPPGFKYNPLLVETRSRRLQLLITQSLAAKLKDKATEEGRSVNDLVNEILANALEK